MCSLRSTLKITRCIDYFRKIPVCYIHAHTGAYVIVERTDKHKWKKKSLRFSSIQKTVHVKNEQELFFHYF